MKKFLKIIGGIILIPYLFVVIIMTVCLINYNKCNTKNSKKRHS